MALNKHQATSSLHSKNSTNLAHKTTNSTNKFKVELAQVWLLALVIHKVEWEVAAYSANQLWVKLQEVLDRLASQSVEASEQTHLPDLVRHLKVHSVPQLDSVVEVSSVLVPHKVSALEASASQHSVNLKDSSDSHNKQLLVVVDSVKHN